MKKKITLVLILGSLGILSAQNSGLVKYRKILYAHKRLDADSNNIFIKSHQIHGFSEKSVKKGQYIFNDTIKQVGHSNIAYMLHQDWEKESLEPYFWQFNVTNNKIVFTHQNEGEDTYGIAPLVREGKGAVYVGDSVWNKFLCNIFELRTPTDTTRYWVTPGLSETAGLAFLDRSVAASGAVVRLENWIRTYEIESIEPKENLNLDDIKLVNPKPAPPLIQSVGARWVVNQQMPDVTAYDCNEKLYSKVDFIKNATLFIVLPSSNHNVAPNQKFIKELINVAHQKKINVIGISANSIASVTKLKQRMNIDIPIIPNAFFWQHFTGFDIEPQFVRVENGIIRYIGSAMPKQQRLESQEKRIEILLSDY